MSLEGGITWKPDPIAEYHDDETKAAILVGKARYGDVFRLKHTDYVVNEWREDFPTLDLARERLAQLIHALTTESKLYTESYDEFLQARLGYYDRYAWRCREFMAELERHGYSPVITDTGGGILLVECQTGDHRTVAWADTMDGYARCGFYPAHLMASGHEGAMVEWHGEERLTAAMAQQVASLLDVFYLVASEAADPHTHAFIPGRSPSYCTHCGVRKESVIALG